MDRKAPFRSCIADRRASLFVFCGHAARLVMSQDTQQRPVSPRDSTTPLISSDQREALILVGASGFSYEEAAAICEVAVGTIKSRVNRARSALTRTLAVQGTGEFGPEPSLQAAMITTAGSSS